MTQLWADRHRKLCQILNIVKDNESEDDILGLALDEYEAERETDVTRRQFGNRDIRVIGALEAGQFSTIDVVKCRLDSQVYIRKTIDKVTVRRYHQQCFPQTERDILLLSLKLKAHFIPHIVASYHTPTSLHIVMDYASGGTLWDVLESSESGTVEESDLRWWVPQAVCAIEWCHEQGFCHRDIKPHNLAIASSGHLRLIDFGSAAPLLPPSTSSLDPDGAPVRLVPKEYSLAPCGTCDYIAPEVLRYFEEEMIIFEAGDSSQETIAANATSTRAATSAGSRSWEVGGSYGAEVDWWSLGVVIYELCFGVAPFFAEDVRKTYFKILNHQDQLKFPSEVRTSADLKGLMKGFLREPTTRLGRGGSSQVKQAPIFANVRWDALHTQPAPPDLHLPQFAYTEDAENGLRRSMNGSVHSRASSMESRREEELELGLHFSQFFQPSTANGNSHMGVTPLRGKRPTEDLDRFLGFTWGPKADAFERETPLQKSPASGNKKQVRIAEMHLAVPPASLPRPPASQRHPHSQPTPYRTPLRPRNTSPRPHTVGRRGITDRDAMQTLVDHIGMSVQKKVLESGRKPRSMKRLSRAAGKTGLPGGGGAIPLSLRFQLGGLENDSADEGTGTRTRLGRVPPPLTFRDVDDDTTGASSSTGMLSPSPSPTPRPGSSMSATATMTLTRRSFTPTATMSRTLTGLSRTHTLDSEISPSTRPQFRRESQTQAQAGRRALSSDAPRAVRIAPSTHVERAPSRPLVFDDRRLDFMERRLRQLEDNLSGIERGLRDLKATIPVG